MGRFSLLSLVTVILGQAVFAQATIEIALKQGSPREIQHALQPASGAGAHR